MTPKSLLLLPFLLLVSWTTAAAFVVPHGRSTRASTGTIVVSDSFGAPRSAVGGPLWAGSLATKEKKGTKLEATTEPEEKDDARSKAAKLFAPIKEAGVAGSISLFMWEAAFWAFSIPAGCFLYFQTAGAWPDFSNKEDLAKVGAEAFAFANIARFALPIRIGLAVATIPWTQKNIVEKFFDKKEE